MAHKHSCLSWAGRWQRTSAIKLARTSAATARAPLLATRLRLSKGRLEGLGSNMRLISYRSSGFPPSLCCGGLAASGVMNPLRRAEHQSPASRRHHASRGAL